MADYTLMGNGNALNYTKNWGAGKEYGLGQNLLGNLEAGLKYENALYDLQNRVMTDQFLIPAQEAALDNTYQQQLLQANANRRLNNRDYQYYNSSNVQTDIKEMRRDGLTDDQIMKQLIGGGMPSDQAYQAVYGKAPPAQQLSPGQPQGPTTQPQTTLDPNLLTTPSYVSKPTDLVSGVLTPGGYDTITRQY